MNEAVATADEVLAREIGLRREYEALVKEVYLDPVRSVVVVDDEFPTLDALVEGQIDQSIGWKGDKKFAADVREILEVCRNRARPWLVDIHDGRVINVDEELNIARHLHHSDLMILDYHLLGENGGGEKSITILRKLAENHHFNMVVVYTKGYVGEDIQKVFDEISLALVNKNFSFLSEAIYEEITDKIQEWEDVQENISDRLCQLITREIYMAERLTPGTFLGGPIGKQVREAVLSKDAPKGLKPPEVANWLMDKWHKKQQGEMSAVDYGPVYSHFSTEVNWMKTNSLFVTVINKKHKPVEIEEKLTKALSSFSPSPHQLLMAKMRAQIDEKGVIAEAAVLNDKYLQAGWLSELFNADHQDKSELIKGTVDRHWEALGDRLRSDIDTFAERLISNLEQVGKDNALKRFGDKAANDSEKILSHINSYNSTKPIAYSHLSTGQILMFSDADGDAKEKELWICLTPLCDLVPGQKSSGWRERLGEKMPFMAVRLSALKVNKAIEKANDNIHVFIKNSAGIEAYSFCPEGNPQANPVWEQMFVADSGKFSKRDSERYLKITRIRDADGVITPQEHEVTVVAQLRYEYALNLLQRLGGSFSRIGLDFRARGKN